MPREKRYNSRPDFVPPVIGRRWGFTENGCRYIDHSRSRNHAGEVSVDYGKGCQVLFQKLDVVPIQLKPEGLGEYSIHIIMQPQL